MFYVLPPIGDVYRAESAHEALDAKARDTGYKDYRELALEEIRNCGGDAKDSDNYTVDGVDLYVNSIAKSDVEEVESFYYEALEKALGDKNSMSADTFADFCEKFHDNKIHDALKEARKEALKHLASLDEEEGEEPDGFSMDIMYIGSGRYSGEACFRVDGDMTILYQPLDAEQLVKIHENVEAFLDEAIDAYDWQSISRQDSFDNENYRPVWSRMARERGYNP
jgi:hypothetical protein